MEQEVIEERYRSVEQVAAHYQVSVSTVRAWIRQQIIPFIKIGGLYRMKFSEIDAALRKRAAENPEPEMPPEQVTVEIVPTEAVVVSPDQDL